MSRRHARLLLAHRLRLRVRVDEHQHLAAAHHELVDGVERLLAQRLRMDQQQRADVLGEAVDVAVLEPHVEELVELLHHLPGLVLHAPGRR